MADKVHVSVKFVDNGWKKLLDETIKLAGATIRVGWVGTTALEQHGKSGLNNAEIATVNEFGSTDGHVPARHALRTTFEKDPKRGRDKLAEGVKQMVMQGKPARTALRLVGRWGKTVVRAEMKKDLPPPNAASTIRQKQSGDTLIDTGKLRDAVRYQIVKNSSSEEEG